LVYPLWGWRRLQATSDFLDAQLGRLQDGQAAIPVVERSLVPVDHVTGQAEALGQAITHNRDLRRFIADALANLPDPMFLTGLDNRVKLANKLSQIGAGDGVVDLPLGAMLDRFVADSDREAVQQYLNQQARNQPADFVDFQSRDSRVFAMRRVPVLSDQNDLRGHIHYLADITALAKASSEREQVIELLSHDMRAPQAAILALLDGQMTPAVRQQIANNARRTLTMADNFVDLARMNANDFEGEPLLVSALLTEAADSFWPIANQRGVTIMLDDRSDCAFVIGEGGTLYRAFCNVIDNAIKYSPDGGRISIDLRRTADDGGDWLSIAIADSGNGIAPAILPRLFERFASSGDRGAAGVKGTGLGLNFVAAVVARHGGSIRADNAERGTGTCFTILLPLAPDDWEDDSSDEGAASIR
jgi:signal transduction histidine kinase